MEPNQFPLKKGLLSASSKKHNSIVIASQDFIRLFGIEVKRQRIAAGYRQEELAEIIEQYGIPISQSYISRLESGQRHDPNISLIVVLSITLQISLDNIISHAVNVQGEDDGDCG